MTQIFVSYSRVDEKTFVKPLIELLRIQYGYNNVWYDEHLVGGPPWWDQILRQINACDVFLYVLTNDSLASLYCQAEHEEAQRLGRPIVYVQARGRTKIPPEIRRFQYIDMTDAVEDAHTVLKLFQGIDFQAEQPRSRRANWKPVTPCPDDLPTEAEEQEQAEQRDQDASTTLPIPHQLLEQPVPDVPSPAWRGRLILAAVVILLTIGGVYFSGIFSSDNSTSTEDDNERTPTDRLDSQLAAAPTDTPTLSPFDIAEAGVATNAEWQPYTQEFDGVEMVLVPAGCFEMGSEDGDSDESPINEICFEEPFWIDRYEVAQDDFTQLDGTQSDPPDFPGDDRPVEDITWFEARDFCEQRGGHLPTEAEWEYAARGPDGLSFPWGSTFEENNVVYSGNSGGETARVGSREGGVSWVGTYDLSGNVWEWTSTIYENYPYDEEDGRESNSNNNSPRVLRGGSWSFGLTDIFRASNRHWGNPDYGNPSLGFRCTRSY